MKKPVITIKELSKNLRQDCCYFVQRFGGLGDSYLLCILKNELEKVAQGKVIFVIKPSHEAVYQMFNEDYIVCADELSVMVDIEIINKPIFKQKHAYKPKLGHFYDPFAYCLGEKYAEVGIYQHINILPTRRDVLTSDKYIVPTNLPQIDKDLQEKLGKIAPLDKIILFCPEANFCPDLPHTIFKYRIKKLRQEGYFVIVNLTRKNSVYRKHFIDGVYDLNLSLSQSIALALSCAGVISTRSGFCDVIFRFCKNLKLYQTFGPRHPSDVYCLSLGLQEEIYIDDVPIYQAFLQLKRKFYEFSLPLKLYNRYIAKGFLKRLRTPFTAYFKIYKKHKANETQSEIKQNIMRDFGLNEAEIVSEIQSELESSYEYQLGRLLEKACKAFWRGGFLAFPFAYLKLRKQKKKLTRFNEILG